MFGESRERTWGHSQNPRKQLDRRGSSPPQTIAVRGSGHSRRAVFAYGLSRPYVSRWGSAFPEDVRRVRAELLPDDNALVTMALETQNGDDEAERHNAALARELDVRTAHHVRAAIRPSRLRDLGALLPGTTFVHGNGLDATELAVIADAGGSLSIAPVVEMVMGLGFPMITEVLAVPGLPITLSVDVEVTSPVATSSRIGVQPPLLLDGDALPALQRAAHHRPHRAAGR